MRYTVLKKILDDVKAKGFTIKQTIMDHDTSGANIACTSFPELGHVLEMLKILKPYTRRNPYLLHLALNEKSLILLKLYSQSFHSDKIS